MAVFVQDVPGVGALGEAAAVVLPHALVQAVVEIEEFEVLELGLRRREQLLAQLDERVHRSADIEEQQQLDRVVPLGPHADIEPTLPCGAIDGAVDVELVGIALTREPAQAAQRDLDVARAELAGIVEVLELALFPHLDRALVLALAADAHAFGVIARVAERAGSAGADPLVAALMALFLLLKPLLERLHDLFPRPQCLDLFHFLVGKEFLGHRLQPVLGDLRALIALERHLQALEHLGEHLVEPVEQAFVLHQRRAREVIELLRGAVDDLAVQRLEQDQVLLEGHRNPGTAQFIHEREEHR